MIKDIQCLHYLGYNDITKLYSYEFKIIDDDFEWEGVGAATVGVGAAEAVEVATSAVINCYSEKKLPIAPNLIKAMFLFKKRYNWEIKNQIIWNKKYCPNWHLVEKDIDKYLLLM